MRKTLTLTFLFLIQVLGVPLFATVTIQGTGGDTLKTIVVPSNYDGKQGTFYAYGGWSTWKEDFSMSPRVMEILDPNNYQVALSGWANEDDTYVSLEKDVKLKSGIYKVRSYENAFNMELAVIQYAYLVVWDTDTGDSGGGNTGGGGTTVVVPTPTPSNDGVDLEAFITSITTTLEGLRAELNGNLNTKTAELLQMILNLQSQLNDAIARHATDQSLVLNQIASVQTDLNDKIADLKVRIAELQTNINEKGNQIQILTNLHNADVQRIETAIANLKAQHETDVAGINAAIDEIKAKLQELNTKFLNGDKALQDQIDDLTEKHDLLKAELKAAKDKHDVDVDKLRSEMSAIEASIRAAHDRDIAVLNGTIDNLNTRFETEKAASNKKIEQLETKLAQLEKESEDGDDALRDLITDTRLQLLSAQNELTALKLQHDREIAEVKEKITKAENDLTKKIDDATADLKQDLLTVDNRYKDLCAQLDSKIQSARDALNAEVAKLNDTDKDLYKEMSDLKEKQADYYARLENIKLTHEHDKQALEAQISELDKKYKQEVDVLKNEITSLKNQIKQAEDTHAREAAELKSQIDKLVNSLDEEVKKIYLELQSQKQALEDHKKAALAKYDLLQSQLNSIQSLLEKRVDELNRLIRYSTYSEEKLQTLLKELESKVSAKEKEIADLQLEIQEKLAKGEDVTSLQEALNRKLSELQDLRKELDAIKQALQIRDDDSEFNVIKNQLAQVVSELALVSKKAEQMVEDLRGDLLATEERLLALIEQIRKESQSGDADLQAQLDAFKAQVMELIKQLQDKQNAGDDELKKLMAELDEQHKKLLEELQGDFQDQLQALKYQQDVQYENLRTTINNIAYQQRYSGGNTNSGNYGLPSMQDKEVPTDSRDLRVSPTEILSF